MPLPHHKFPAVYVYETGDGSFRWALMRWIAGKGWVEFKMSPGESVTWLEAHMEGSEAIASLMRDGDKVIPHPDHYGGKPIIGA